MKGQPITRRGALYHVLTRLQWYVTGFWIPCGQFAALTARGKTFDIFFSSNREYRAGTALMSSSEAVSLILLYRIPLQLKQYSTLGGAM